MKISAAYLESTVTFAHTLDISNDKTSVTIKIYESAYILMKNNMFSLHLIGCSPAFFSGQSMLLSAYAPKVVKWEAVDFSLKETCDNAKLVLATSVEGKLSYSEKTGSSKSVAYDKFFTNSSPELCPFLT